MPNVGSQVLDVALGLLFVLLVFSLVCTALQELVATALSSRAAFLEKGLRRLLAGAGKEGADAATDGTAKEAAILTDLLANPRIAELVPDPRRLRKTRKLPSYLNSSTFSIALLDTLAPPPKDEPSEDLLARVRTAVAKLPSLTSGASSARSRRRRATTSRSCAARSSTGTTRR